MQGVREGWTAMASLSHTVVFHTTGDDLDMIGAGGEERWMCQEARSDRLEDGRITHHSRIWADGKHIATTLQDGMIRLPREEGESKL